MAKAILEFKIPDNIEEYKRAYHGHVYYSIVLEIYRRFGDLAVLDNENLTTIKALVLDRLANHKIDLT